MKTLTLKINASTNERLEEIARTYSTTKSEIVRNAIKEYMSRAEKVYPGTFLNAAKDLVGSLEGPPDLSTQDRYLDGYGE